jgi:putative ABC transport system permease protein
VGSILLAWLQLTFEKRRFFAALAGITFAVVLMLMQLGLREVLFRASSLVPTHVAADLVMLHRQYEFLYALRSYPEQRLHAALAVPGVRTVTPAYLQMGSWKNPDTRDEHRIAVIGVPVQGQALDLPSLGAQMARLEASDAVLFDAASRPEYGPIAATLDRGSVVTEVNDRRVTVVGTFDLGASFGAGGHLLTSDRTFSRLFGRPLDMIDVGLIRIEPGANLEAVRDAIAGRLPGDVMVLTREDFGAREADYWERRAAIGFIFDLGAVMGLLVGGVIVYQILYTDVVNHLDEYATLKAMGVRDRYLYAVVLNESALLSVLGFVPGYAIAELLYALARQNAHVPVEMTLARAVGVFLLTVLMCVASGWLAMRKLAYADPAEVF